MRHTESNRSGPLDALKRKPTVLIVDDEPDIVEFVSYNLKREQFETTNAADGPSALRRAKEDLPDLILLDLMLPGINGLEVCRQLRMLPETSHIPIIMLTAKGAESDIVTGLELGADDYVPKPFSMRLLLARIRAVLRRANRFERDTATRVTQVGDLLIDDERHEVTVGEQAVQLTLTEYKLLRFLARNAGRVYTRSQILGNILDENVLVVDRAIDVHVAALRRKLGDAATRIETVRGVGYRFSP